MNDIPKMVYHSTYVGDTIRITYVKNSGEENNAPSVSGGTLVSVIITEEWPGPGNSYNGRYHVDVKLTDKNVNVYFNNPGHPQYNDWSAMNNENTTITLVS